MNFSNAAVNGLFAPSPSAATDPALAANAISVSDVDGSTFANPLLTERVPRVRFIDLENGLSRHASRMTNLNRLTGSRTFRMRSRETASSSTSMSRSLGCRPEPHVTRVPHGGPVARAAASARPTLST